VTSAPRRRGALVLLAAVPLLVGAACGGDDGGGASSGERAAGDREAAGDARAFCDMADELQEATTAVPGVAGADEMQRAVDRLEEAAAEAPPQVADELAVLTGVLERLVTAMRSATEGDAAATVEAVQEVLTPETTAQVEDASRNVEAFLDVECGIADAGTGGEAATVPQTPPTSAAPGDPAALGDDPALGPLATACHGGDMLRCDELYLAAPAGSPYEAYGDTCGNRTTVDEFCVDVYPPPTSTTAPPG
jgi:hypothetical protein